jgi:DNA-binding transcriptional MerR regulator
VEREGLITIGRFALLAGVSVHALRHYDEVGLLAPAQIDPASGYRRYLRTQIHDARLIRALRWMDVPIEDIRRILEFPADASEVLSRHRHRLERQRSLLDGRISELTRYLEEGVVMPTVQSGCRPVQIMLAVNNVEKATVFYKEAFGIRHDISRRTENADYSSFQFGTYGRDDFYLLWLLDDRERLDFPERSNFAFLVDDVDRVHARAIAAGATEDRAPYDAEGMPRSSGLRDPDGNGIGLAQGGAGCRPVRITLAVDDREDAIDFYRKAFGFKYDVIRRTSRGNSSSFLFGEYGRDDFFLLLLVDDPERLDRPGRSNISLLVEDLDTFHGNALAAGATEAVAPRDLAGMPRSSAVKDPYGNWIGLAQG